MTRVLGFAFFLLFLAGIALVSLKGRQLSQLGLPGGGAGITGIEWRPVAIGAEPVPEDSGMFVSFEVDGGIEGHGGCNGFYGALQEAESGVETGAISVTRKACAQAVMGREGDFLDALERMRELQSDGDTLRLLDEEGELLAELVKNERSDL